MKPLNAFLLSFFTSLVTSLVVFTSFYYFYVISPKMAGEGAGTKAAATQEQPAKAVEAAKEAKEAKETKEAKADDVPETAKVPSLVGLTPDQAQVMLKDAELLFVMKDKVPSDKIDKGSIVKQTPLAESVVKKGSEVVVSVSSGPEVKETPKVPIPDLSGLTVEKATEMLVAIGLEVGEKEEKESAEVEKGKVIATDPPADSQVEAGESVTLIVSKGEDTVEVPKLKGKRSGAAKKALKKLGLKYKIAKDYDEDYSEGVVLGTKPKDGEKVKPGTKITIIVNDEDY